MAGFEVIVRPAVFPNIRPGTARVLPPPDDPEQGKFVLSGGGGKFMGTSLSYSVSSSKQSPAREKKRQFDVERVYQVSGKGGGKAAGRAADGDINRNNYVDIERLKKVRLDRDDGPEDNEILNRIYADPPKADNVETILTDQTRQAGTQS